MPRPNEPLYVRTSRIIAFDLSARAVYEHLSGESLTTDTPFPHGERYYYATLEHFLELNKMGDRWAEQETSLFKMFTWHRQLLNRRLLKTEVRALYANFLNGLTDLSSRVYTSENPDYEEVNQLLRFNRLTRYAAETRLVEGFYEFLYGHLGPDEQEQAMGPLLKSDLFYAATDPDYWRHHSPAYNQRHLPHAFAEWVTTMREKYHPPQ